MRIKIIEHEGKYYARIGRLNKKYLGSGPYKNRDGSPQTWLSMEFILKNAAFENLESVKLAINDYRKFMKNNTSINKIIKAFKLWWKFK